MLTESEREHLEEMENKRLDQLLELQLPLSLDASFVQRNLLIGYNFAIHVLERGVDRGVFEKAEVPYKYNVIKGRG